MTDDAKMPTKLEAIVLDRLVASGGRAEISTRRGFYVQLVTRSNLRTAPWIEWCGCGTYNEYKITDLGRRALSLYESKHGPINKETDND